MKQLKSANASDLRWMKVALALAEKGRPLVSPNPMVGACVIQRGRLVGEGYHAHYGGQHAEVVALKRAGRKARGATLHVTLEPCSTWGKTPPCVPDVIEAGIRRVVIGTLDANPVNRGKSLALFRRAGISVRTGIMADAVMAQNKSFFTFMKTKRPFVTLKMAQTLDGKIATCAGHSRWISSPEARRFVHRLRFEQDAILVGKNTLLLDDPLLSPRLRKKKGPDEKPWRIILDPKLEASARARVFQGNQLTVTVTSDRMIKRISPKASDRRILLPVREKKGRLDLAQLLDKLAGLGIAKLLVEGGGETAWSFLRAGLVDQIYWIVAPKLIGGRSAKTSVEGEGIQNLDDALCLKEINVTRLGKDFIFEGRF